MEWVEITLTEANVNDFWKKINAGGYGHLEEEDVPVKIYLPNNMTLYFFGGVTIVKLRQVCRRFSGVGL